MALDLDTLVELAKRRIIAGLPDLAGWASAEIEITANVPAAGDLAARRVMRNPTLRGRLQQSYSITLDGAGIGDLSTAAGSVTALTNELFLEGIELGSVVDSTGVALHHLPHYNDFISPQATVFDYFHITDQKKILTRARNAGQVYSAADIVSASGPLGLRASYMPSVVSGWPPELEDILVTTLVEIALQKIPGAIAAPAG